MKNIVNLQKYVKLFSRDFCLASVEAWVRGESINSKQWTIEKQPFLPYIITQRADDTVAFYYNLQGVEWIQNLLVKYANEDNNFLKKIVKTVLKKLEFIRPIYEKESILDLTQLKRFLTELEDGYPLFEAMWWFCQMDEKKLIGLNLENIQKVRALTDKLCNSSDTVIRKSLIQIYPQLSNLSSTLRIEEILTEKIPNNQELQKRDSGYFFGNNQLITNLDKSAVEMKFGIHFIEEKYKKVRVLRGNIAQMGFVRGYVRKVMGHKQISEVQDGEILVSPMTIPDFLPAMRKAAAFVTDEGGVLCHAAIVAREFKKPCIVGTSYGTKRFDNGDLVEVNANNGSVVKLCHAAIIAKMLKKPCVVGTKFATTIFEDGDYIEVDANKGLIKLIKKSSSKVVTIAS